MRVNGAFLTAGIAPVQGLATGLPGFQQRWPWWGADLQTLRDTLRRERLPADGARLLTVPVGGGDQLAVCCDPPLQEGAAPGGRGLVVLLHGLAGHSGRQGVRRLGWLLQQQGFAVWRLNLRGAGPGRPLASGTYAAACSGDILPVLAAARRQAGDRPLLGAGLSLGGTVLLNALLMQPDALDGLVCVSSPLDLAASSRRIEARRNAVYSRWLLQRLIAQTLADPGGLSPSEREALLGPTPPRSIRAFDAAITAPRWGHASVEAYYAAASPLPGLLQRARGERAWDLPPGLIVHAADDPWVPVDAAHRLQQTLATAAEAMAQPAPWQVSITARGGHNGFHDRRAPRRGGLEPRLSWSDRCASAWLLERSAAWGAAQAGGRGSSGGSAG